MLLILLAVAIADGSTGPGVLAAFSARRWLARHAAGVKRVRNAQRNIVPWTTPACTGLVSCLPALETAALQVPEPLDGEDWGCMLEALARCTRLTSLHLCMTPCAMDNKGKLVLVCIGSDTPAFAKLHGLAKLRGLTKLALSFGTYDTPALADVVDAISPLTGLTELLIRFDDILEPAVVPAALGQLKGLQSLKLCRLEPDVFEAGCFDLPNLVSLEFDKCNFPEVEVLPGISSLQKLTCIESQMARDRTSSTLSLRNCLGCSAWCLNHGIAVHARPGCQQPWAL